MIGIVVVSHSRPLAEAAVALASAMITDGEAPRIGIAAGLDAPEGTEPDGTEPDATEPDATPTPHTAASSPILGTDATAVAETIDACDSPDGVLVLMDLGSAVMSAQLAVEFLDEDLAARVRLCGAPLVEGLVTAVAAAASGASLSRAAEQAQASLTGKLELLGGPTSSPSTLSPSTSSPSTSSPSTSSPSTSSPSTSASFGIGPVSTRDVPVTSPVGLHLRPASLLAGLVASYDAEVRVSDLDSAQGPVPGDSLADLLTLGAEQGHHLHLEAVGPQAEAVLEAVADLAATGFGDVESPSA